MLLQRDDSEVLGSNRRKTVTYHFSTDSDVTVDHYGSIQGPRANGTEGELDVYLTVKASFAGDGRWRSGRGRRLGLGYFRM